MHTEPSGSAGAADPRLERAIVLQLLREDRQQQWSHRELAAELRAEASVLEAAVLRLGGDGVLCSADGAVWASRAARRLDELELIGI